MRIKEIEKLNRHKLLLEFIKDFMVDNGYGPTYAEIEEGINLPHSTAYRYVTELEAQGYLTTHEGHIVSTPQDTIGVKGSIKCGPFGEVIEFFDEPVAVPFAILGKGEHYALRASGDSMQGDHIYDGDTIVIRKQPDAETGDIIVAYIDGYATLKHYYPDKRKKIITLKPTNTDYDDIVIREKDIIIQGKAIAVVHNL